MPTLASRAQLRLNNITKQLSLAPPLLNELCDAFGSPFLKAISTITLSISAEAESIKRNKDDCIRLMEQVHTVLCGVIELHMKAGEGSALPPAILEYLGHLTKTLQKIHTYVEAQQDAGRIKHFFHQNATRTLLKECETGLQQALAVFKVEHGTAFSTNINEMQKNMREKHDEILALISVSPTRASSINSAFASLDSSTNSLSMLPGEPKIFHGRETELNHVLDILLQPLPRIVILGAGGIGKTTVAKAVLHHPGTVAKYQNNRFFVSCDSVSTNIDLAALIATHLGLKFTGANVINRVLNHFSKGPPTLVVLDNMETPWEPLDSRSDVEELLSLLTDVQDLALIVTMRGAERPSKVQWSRPFLRPLQPLTHEAAKQTFLDIADDIHDPRDIEKLLLLTDNMALAVELIAHLAQHEGCPTVLSRWSEEKTSLLSTGGNKTTSLEVSIMLSLHSPRMSALPGAKMLLSLLSVLPDGISDTDLVQSAPEIPDMLAAKTALLRTSLAYLNHDGRLKVLVPIREYIQRIHPVSPSVVFPVRYHLHGLLKLYKKYRGFMSTEQLLNRIMSNLGNLQSILVLALKPNDLHLEQAVECSLLFGRVCHVNGRGRNIVMEHIPSVLPYLQSPQLHARFLADSFMSWREGSIQDPEAILNKVEALFTQFHDIETKCIFYIASSIYQMEHNNDFEYAIKSLETGLNLSKCGGDPIQFEVLDLLSWTNWRLGNYHKARGYAREAKALAVASGEMFSESRALRMESLSCISLGIFRDCVQLCRRSRKLLELCGHSQGESHDVLLNTEAETHMHKSEYAEARRIHAHIAHEVSPEQAPYNYALALQNVASIDVMIGGNADDISSKLDETRVIFNTMEHPTGILFADIIQADLELREGNAALARLHFEKCLSLAWRTNDEQAAFCLQRLGDVGLWHPEDIDWTFKWSIIFLGHALQSKSKLEIHQALRCVGNMFRTEGDQDTAHSLFAVALEGFTEMDIHQGRASCMLRLGDIAGERGDLRLAVELWTTARPLFEKSLQTKGMQEVDKSIETVGLGL